MKLAFLVCGLGAAWLLALIASAVALVMGLVPPAYAGDACPTVEEFVAAATIMEWPFKTDVAADLQSREDIDTFAVAWPPPMSMEFLGAQRIIVIRISVPHSNEEPPQLIVAFRDGCPAYRHLTPARTVTMILGIVKGRRS